MSPVFVRKPDLRELSACFSLDGGYETEYIWQLRREVARGTVSATFQKVRLPRVLKVRSPIIGEILSSHWDQGSVLVAKEGTQICGFIDISMDNEERTGMVEYLIVDRPFRRKGIGTRLLTEAEALAASELRLERLIVPVPSKNYPATLFLESNGFHFAGYSDFYFRSGDVALFYGISLT
jgi:RimJ/RimL family protein N-acetyltransferase